MKINFQLFVALAALARLGSSLPIEARDPAPLSAAEEELVDAIAKAMEAAVAPVANAAAIEGLTLKTSLELDSDGDVDTALSGVQFKATVELAIEESDDGRVGTPV